VESKALSLAWGIYSPGGQTVNGKQDLSDRKITRKRPKSREMPTVGDLRMGAQGILVCKR
jgi:hypothetical protein